MNLPILAAWCDFGHCGSSCWRHCNIHNGRWDGAPTNLYREVWKLRRRPMQQSLLLEQEWMRGWNACLDAIDRLGGFKRG